MADHFRTAPDWEDVRVFVALARYGGLSAAARALGVNHATVARRLASLEASLDARLVERRPGGYGLTDAGRLALEAAAAMESAAQALPRRSAPDAITGLVRISATPTLAETFLIPRLADLSRAHPGVDIELAAEIRSASLARREADLALRLADPEDGEVIARRMATLGFGLYANEDWRRRLAAGARPTFVTFDEANAHVPEAIWLAQRFPTARIALRLNSQAAQAAAAEAGFGVVLLPDFLGRSLPALAPVPIAEAPPSREVWLLSRPGADAVAAVRLVREALTEIFRRDAALLAPD